MALTHTELKLLTLHAAGRTMTAIASNCGQSLDEAGLMTYALRKRLGMGPLASVREWSRSNLHTLVAS